MSAWQPIPLAFSHVISINTLTFGILNLLARKSSHSILIFSSQNILADIEEAPDADSKGLIPQLHPRMQELVKKYGSVL